nr:hypothetical protein [Dehalococcoidia bacterium]
HRKIDLNVAPAKNSSSTNTLSNPDIGPQSSASAREAIMKQTPRRAVSESSYLRPRRIVLNRLLGSRVLWEGLFGVLPEVYVATDYCGYPCFHGSEGT